MFQGIVSIHIPGRMAKIAKSQPPLLVLAAVGCQSRGTREGLSQLPTLLSKEALHHLLQIGCVHLDVGERLSNLAEADGVVCLQAAVHVEVTPVLLNHLAAVPDQREPERSRRSLQKVAQFRKLSEVFCRAREGGWVSSVFSSRLGRWLPRHEAGGDRPKMAGLRRARHRQEVGEETETS
jgi:hypothetical protein